MAELGHVSPSLMVQYSVDVPLRHSEFIGQLSLCDSPCRVNFANIRHINLGESGPTAHFAPQVRYTVTPLCVHIRVVLSIRAEPEMRGIHATPNVACVTNADAVPPLSRRDRPVGHFPRNSMNGSNFAPDFKRAVASSEHRTCPQPALACAANSNLCPKAFRVYVNGSLGIGHSNLLIGLGWRSNRHPARTDYASRERRVKMGGSRG